MSKYCIVCGKVKEWENPFIEGEPLTCDTCASKINRQLSKLVAMRRHTSTIHKGQELITQQRDGKGRFVNKGG